MLAKRAIPFGQLPLIDQVARMAVATIFLAGLTALVSIALAIIRLKGRTEVHLYLSIAVLFFVSLVYANFEHIKSVLPVTAVEFGLLTVKTLWWIALAFLFNAIFKHFVFKSTTKSGEGSSVPPLLQHLFAILIYLIALMIVLQYVFGHSITAVATASGAIALVLGYSSRTVLDELFSGLALYANEPFEKGHLIQLNDVWYFVEDINWRTTTFLDMDQNAVVVPNTTVATSRILNLDRPTRLTRRTLFFEVEYDVPPKIVVAEAEAAMKECPTVADHPWNFVSFFSFEKSGMRYKLHFHIEDFDNWYVASDELINAMWYRFSRAGIRFAHQRHLNYTTELDEKKGLRNSAYDEENFNELIERFCHIPVFEGMTDEDMEEMVKSAPFHIFGPPEHLTYAGAMHSSMFLIVSGEVDLFEVDEAGRETHMMTVSEYGYVGLMSLLTGAPQRTSIRAAKESVVCEITSEALHALFERKPKIMENIATYVAKWQVEEEAISAIAWTRSQENARIKKRTSSLTKRITAFFKVSSEEVDG